MTAVQMIVAGAVLAIGGALVNLVVDAPDAVEVFVYAGLIVAGLALIVCGVAKAVVRG